MMRPCDPPYDAPLALYAWHALPGDASSAGPFAGHDAAAALAVAGTGKPRSGGRT